MTSWRARPEVDVCRTVRGLSQSRRLRRTADPWCILDEGVRVSVVDGHRPVLRNRSVRRHSQSIEALALERLAVIERRQRVISCLEPGPCLQHRLFEDHLRLLIGFEGLAPLYPDGLERIDHCPVALKPRLLLHHS